MFSFSVYLYQCIGCRGKHMPIYDPAFFWLLSIKSNCVTLAAWTSISSITIWFDSGLNMQTKNKSDFWKATFWACLQLHFHVYEKYNNEFQGNWKLNALHKNSIKLENKVGNDIWPRNYLQLLLNLFYLVEVFYMKLVNNMNGKFWGMINIRFQRISENWSYPTAATVLMYTA